MADFCEHSGVASCRRAFRRGRCRCRHLRLHSPFGPYSLETPLQAVCRSLRWLRLLLPAMTYTLAQLAHSMALKTHSRHCPHQRLSTVTHKPINRMADQATANRFSHPRSCPQNRHNKAQAPRNRPQHEAASKTQSKPFISARTCTSDDHIPTTTTTTKTRQLTKASHQWNAQVARTDKFLGRNVTPESWREIVPTELEGKKAKVKFNLE